MSKRQLRILLIEDDEDDAILIQHHIKRAGYTIVARRVDTPEAMQTALQDDKWDVVISDYTMPHFSGFTALNLLQETGLDIPFIMVSGRMGEENAVEAMRAGAHDYLIKDNLKRLVPAIERELQEAKERYALRAAESQIAMLSQAMAQSASLVLIASKGGRVQYANAQYYRLTGYTEDEVIGRRARHLLNIPEDVYQHIKAGNEFRGEVHNTRKEGDEYWAILTISPIRDAAGKLQLYLMTQEDITERKKLEAQLQRYNDLLESMVDDRMSELSEKNRRLQQEIAERELAQSELAVARDKALEVLRLKNEILANVNHDMKTPLSVIKLYTQMLQRTALNVLTEKQAHMLETILEEVEHLTGYLSDILSIANIEASRVNIKQDFFQPHDLLNATLATFLPISEKRHLQLTCEIAEDMPTTLYGDVARISSILSNLIGNAIQYTDEGTVAVSLERPNSSYWSIIVSDTGKGIPSALQPQLFEPFWQADTSSKRTTSRGSGLGLVIVKQYTEIMGGTVHVESDGQAGSTFTITLPLVMDNHAAPPNSDSEHSPS